MEFLLYQAQIIVELLSNMVFYIAALYIDIVRLCLIK